MSLDGSAILVTGGTGSFGRQFIATVLERHDPAKVIVYSRDELKQFEMQHSQPFAHDDDVLRWFIGDVRDEARLRRAIEDVDVVVHAAALNQVPAAEYNPFEAVQTNIVGAENVINASMHSGVSRVVALSSGKAAAPIDMCGATRLASDKLFVAANNHRGPRDIRFSVVRCGNVMGARGSVVPFLRQEASSGVIPVADERMTQFTITRQQAVDFVLACLARMWGGEIFVPKIPAYRFLDLAEAISPDADVKISGIRSGEKLHEQLITSTDSLATLEFDEYYVILPSYEQWDVDEFRSSSSDSPGRACAPGFSYDSGSSQDRLSVDELRELVATECP